MHFADDQDYKSNMMTNMMMNVMTNMMINVVVKSMANMMISISGKYYGMYENRDDQFTADQVLSLGKSSQPYGARSLSKITNIDTAFYKYLQSNHNEKIIQTQL